MNLKIDDIVWINDENSYGRIVSIDLTSVDVKLDIDGDVVSCGYEQVSLDPPIKEGN